MADQCWGFLVMDKPAGLTSHACVARVRRAYRLRRVGHGGTLDPAVTGVLPLALGPATRLLPYLEGSKRYLGSVQLGVRTDSDDLSGVVLEQRPWPHLETAQLEAVLAGFRGPVLQVPPQISAVHVEGERAYARARRGETLALKARTVVVEELDLMHWDASTGRLHLQVQCSAGTYIRSLARDLGERLGCGGALAELRRTAALGFQLEQSFPIEALDQDPPPALLDPLRALDHLPRRQLLPEELAGWRCGRALEGASTEPQGGAVAVLTPDGNLAGVAQARTGGLLQPRLVFDAAG